MQFSVSYILDLHYLDNLLVILAFAMRWKLLINVLAVPTMLRGNLHYFNLILHDSEFLLINHFVKSYMSRIWRLFYLCVRFLYALHDIGLKIPCLYLLT